MFLISAQIAGDLYRGQLAATDTVCLKGIDIKVIYINLSQEAPLRAGAMFHLRCVMHICAPILRLLRNVLASSAPECAV